jgi:hypothetical protein
MMQPFSRKFGFSILGGNEEDTRDKKQLESLQEDEDENENQENKQIKKLESLGEIEEENEEEDQEESEEESDEESEEENENQLQDPKTMERNRMTKRFSEELADAEADKSGSLVGCPRRCIFYSIVAIGRIDESNKQEFQDDTPRENSAPEFHFDIDQLLEANVEHAVAYPEAEVEQANLEQALAKPEDHIFPLESMYAELLDARDNDNEIALEEIETLEEIVAGLK